VTVVRGQRELNVKVTLSDASEKQPQGQQT